MADTPTFGRFPEIPYERMTLEQQESLRFVLDKRGRLPGPTKIYVHNPNLAKAIAPFGAHLRKTLSLSLREREIVVCIVTGHWHCAYATQVHERDAKAAGLPPEQIEAIISGLPATFADKREQIIYEMAICLINGRWVSKGLYERAVEVLGHVSITDVIALIGSYTVASLTLAFYDVPAGAPSLERGPLP